MGKMIFLDVDGTLYAKGKGPDEDTVQALQRARKNGHKVFLSTSRRETNIPEAVRTIGTDGGIYSAGGRAVVEGKEVYRHPVPPQTVQLITEVLQKQRIPYMLEDARQMYKNATTCADMAVASSSIERWETPFCPVICSEGLTCEDIYKIAFLAASKAQTEQIARMLGTRVHVHCFSSFFKEEPIVAGEITDRSIHKGKALISICHYLGTDTSDCLAFGDSWNDAEILQTAGIGVAMGNADAYIREIADQVCERYDEGGIEKTLKRMSMI